MDLAPAEFLDYRMGGVAAASGALARPQAGSAPADVLSDHFAAVVERYQAPLISFLFGMVGTREQAEDLAQETLIKAYEHMRDRRADQVYTSGWLFRIARNAAIDSLRRRRLISWLPFGSEHETALPARGDFATQLADRDVVQQVLARMPARYRECLILRSVADMSNTEIAVTMGISARNANTTLFRARERFREIYHQIEGSDQPQPRGHPKRGAP